MTTTPELNTFDELVEIFNRAVVNHLQNYIKLGNSAALSQLTDFLDDIKVNFRLYSADKRDIAGLWDNLRSQETVLDMTCEVMADFLWRSQYLLPPEGIIQALGVSVAGARVGTSDQRGAAVMDSDFINRGMNVSEWVYTLGANTWLMFPLLWKFSHMTSDVALIKAGLRLGPKGKVIETTTAG